jgi:hypothetical protein
MLDRRTQRETIARATQIFERAGLRPTGFRGPYLRYNQATLEVLRELGFLYHSSQAVAFPPRDSQPDSARASSAYGLALQLYSALDATRHAVTPRLRDGLVDIPVAIPDDEIILDRLRLTEPARTAEWLHILDITHERGDLFTVQLHPERILELGEALEAVLHEARRRQPAVFIGRLDEIASWWLRRSRFSIEVTRGTDGASRVRVNADEDATLLVRGLDVSAEPWFGRDAITDVHVFDARSTRVPVVGVSRRSPAALRDFLGEEGFPYEVSDHPESFGAYLDVDDGWAEMDVLDRIEQGPGPLVRIWRWPHGARSALAVTGDVDALTLRDFLTRSWETRSVATGRWNQR